MNATAQHWWACVNYLTPKKLLTWSVFWLFHGLHSQNVVSGSAIQTNGLPVEPYVGSNVGTSPNYTIHLNVLIMLL